MNQPLGIDEVSMSAKSMTYKDQMNSQQKNDSKKSTSNKINERGVKANKKSSISASIGVTGFTASEQYLCASYFDETAFNNFCRANGFSHVIRSHNIVPVDGMDIRFGNRCITVFSCTNYMQQFAKLHGEGEAKESQSSNVEPANNCTVAFVDGGNSRIRMLAFDTRGYLEPTAANPGPVSNT